MGQFRHQLAALFTTAHVHLHIALRRAAGSVFSTQLLQSRNAGGGLGAAGFHTSANPHLFLRQQLVGFGVDHRLLRQLLGLVGHVRRKVAGVRHQLATVQFHNARGYVVQERAVVRNQYDRTLEFLEQTFQPLNRIQIQMVGRLVKEQHIGLHHQGLCQSNALAHTARQAAHFGFRVQVQALQRFFYALLPVPGVLRLNARLQRIQIHAFRAR